MSACFDFLKIIIFLQWIIWFAYHQKNYEILLFSNKDYIFYIVLHLHYLAWPYKII